MSTQKKTQPSSEEELRNEHIRLVVEKEHLEERLRELENEANQTEQSRRSKD